MGGSAKLSLILIFLGTIAAFAQEPVIRDETEPQGKQTVQIKGTNEIVTLEDGVHYTCTENDCQYVIQHGSTNSFFAKVQTAILGKYHDRDTSCEVWLEQDSGKNKLHFWCDTKEERMKVLFQCVQYDRLPQWPEYPVVNIDLQLVTFTTEGLDNIRNELGAAIGNFTAAGDVTRAGFDLVDGISSFSTIVGNRETSFLHALIKREEKRNQATLREATSIPVVTGAALERTSERTLFRDNPIGVDAMQTGFLVNGGSVQVLEDKKHVGISDFTLTYRPRTNESFSVKKDEKEPRSLADKIVFKISRMNFVSGQTYLMMGQTTAIEFVEETKSRIPVVGTVINLFGGKKKTSTQKVFLIFLRPRIVHSASLELAAPSEGFLANESDSLSQKEVESLGNDPNLSFSEVLSALKVRADPLWKDPGSPVPISLQFDREKMAQRFAELRLNVEIKRISPEKGDKIQLVRRAGSLTKEPIWVNDGDFGLSNNRQRTYRLKLTLDSFQKGASLHGLWSLTNGVKGMEYLIVYTPGDDHQIFVQSAKPVRFER
jgi:hypothetical protein